jgi:SAM-dependent methyltransferase
MTEPEFDTTGLFDEDYLHFYAERTNLERSAAETDLIWRLLALEPGMEVLDLACGHGRIANRLAERGCRTTGLDITAHFLRQARQDAENRGVTVDYRHGDMRVLPWTNKFDRIVNWFTSFGYFDDAGNRRVLTETARALRPGGLLAIELNNFAWLLRNFQRTVVVDRDGDLLLDRTELDLSANRNVVHRTMIRDGRRRDVRFFVRLFTFTELQTWLHDAGFSQVAAYGEDGGPLSLESRRMIVTAAR